MIEIGIPTKSLSLTCKSIRVLVSQQLCIGLSLGDRIQIGLTEFELIGFEIPGEEPDSVWLELSNPIEARIVQLSLFASLKESSHDWQEPPI